MFVFCIWGFSFIIVIMGIYVIFIICWWLYLRWGLSFDIIIFRGSVLISGILLWRWWIVYHWLCDNGFIYYHWLVIIFFSFLGVCFGLWVYNPCDVVVLYDRLWFYLCFLDPNVCDYIILILWSLFCDLV